MCAARIRFGSSVSCLSSESLSTRQSTSATVCSSDSWAMSIHRFIESIATNRAAAALLAHLALEVGLDVAEEQHLGVARRRRELRLEVLEDVQVGLQRVALVDVAVVAAGPEERLAAGDVLDVVGQHAAAVQDRRTPPRRSRRRPGRRSASRANCDAGEREVHRGAAEQPVAAPGRGLDGVEGDGSDHGERHGRRVRLASCLRPSPSLLTMRAIRDQRMGRPGGARAGRGRAAARAATTSRCWSASRARGSTSPTPTRARTPTSRATSCR